MSLRRLQASLADLGTRGGLGADEQVRSSARPAAVLALFSDGENPDLVFTERAATLRAHAGQMSFPGGRVDPEDASEAAAALREASEEIDLDPGAVTLLGEMPRTGLTRSLFNVVAVVGTWDGSAPLRVVDAAEVASIHRFPVSALAAPEHRVTVHHRGTDMPAFVFDDLMVWGFTAHLTDELLRLGGWERPWDRDRVVAIPRRFLRSGL